MQGPNVAFCPTPRDTGRRRLKTLTAAMDSEDSLKLLGPSEDAVHRLDTKRLIIGTHGCVTNQGKASAANKVKRHKAGHNSIQAAMLC